MGLVITTSSAAAAARYVDGVELLLSSSPDAIAMLQAAVAADPAFGVALAALAWGTAGQPGADGAPLDALTRERGGIVFSHPSGTTAHRDRGHCVARRP